MNFFYFFSVKILRGWKSDDDLVQKFVDDDLSLERSLISLEDNVKYREVRVDEIRADLDKETAAYEKYFTTMVDRSKSDESRLDNRSRMSSKTPVNIIESAKVKTKIEEQKEDAQEKQ